MFRSQEGTGWEPTNSKYPFRFNTPALVSEKFGGQSNAHLLRQETFEFCTGVFLCYYIANGDVLTL